MRGYVKEEELDRYNGIQDQIKQNSADWAKETNPERRQGLHNANEYLYSALDKMDGGKSTFNPDTGKWNTQYWFDNSWQNSPVPSASKYVSPFSGKIDNGISNLENKKFSYNPESDPGYQAYKKMYNREGDRALKSTLSSVSAAQGGISSYASQAAQQASNYYAQQLTDKIPELEQLAYQKYQDDYNNQLNLVNLYKTLDDTYYGRFNNDRYYKMDQDKFDYQKDFDDRNMQYNYDTLNSDNYFRGRSADNADLETAYTGAQLNKNLELSDWDMFEKKLAQGYTPSSEEMARWELSEKDVEMMKTFSTAQTFGTDSPIFNMINGGNPYAPVDPFGVSTGSGHGTSGYTGGSGGSNKYSDYMSYKKEANGEQASGGYPTAYQYVPVNYPASGGYPSYTGGSYTGGNYPYTESQPTVAAPQSARQPSQDSPSAQQPTNTAQQQNQASTPQAAQSASSTVTSDTEKNTSGTAEQTPAKEEQKSSARRDALSERGQAIYDQLVKNDGHMGNFKWEKNDQRDYIDAYNAYSADRWDSKEEENNIYKYPYGSPEIRQGSPKTLDEWYTASGYDPKNEGRTPILLAAPVSGKTSGRKKTGKKPPYKKTGGDELADDTFKEKIVPYDAKDYIQIKEMQDDIMQKNTDLYNKGTKGGKWIDKEMEREYQDNVDRLEILFGRKLRG